MVDFEKAEEDYTAKDIELLSELEGVRKRPGMYIGSTNLTGLHHLVWEIVDNAVDEAVNGFGDRITVTIFKRRLDSSRRRRTWHSGRYASADAHSGDST
jgi:DNA gyrase/topoisomerase IV subunit B